MKMIERFAFFESKLVLPIGIFTAAGTTVTKIKFNIIVTGLYAGVNISDDVTNQGVDGVGFFEAAFPVGADNPAILSDDLAIPRMTVRSGRVNTLPIFAQLSSGRTYNYAMRINLFEVTANAISADYYFSVKYLCPEDYMSVEGFGAAIP